MLLMSELYVKIRGRDYEHSLLSNDNRLSDYEQKDRCIVVLPASYYSDGRLPLNPMKRTIPMKRYFHFQRIIVLLVISIALSSVAFGQELTGVLTGTVKDANAAAVKGA